MLRYVTFAIFELETGAAKLEYEGHSLLVVCLYRPPWCAGKDVVDKISSMLKKVRSLSYPVIITGDINIHFEDPIDLHTSRLVQMLLSKQFHQHIRQPTHLASRAVDVIITGSNDIISDIAIEPQSVSDHCVVTCSYQQCPTTKGQWTTASHQVRSGCTCRSCCTCRIHILRCTNSSCAMDFIQCEEVTDIGQVCGLISSLSKF